MVLLRISGRGRGVFNRREELMSTALLLQVQLDLDLEQSRKLRSSEIRERKRNFRLTGPR